jgi:hypothetical protein
MPPVNQLPKPLPRWMSAVLLAAAAYNVVWGTLIVWFPLASLRWAGLEPPNYPQLWQCVGMMVAVFGVGYGIAAFNPRRHWPIVLVGLLGKVLGPIGFLHAAVSGQLPWAFGWINVANDLIWWLPFFLILRRVRRDHIEEVEKDVLPIAEACARIPSQHGSHLGTLSLSAPVLIVFLRHLG